MPPCSPPAAMVADAGVAAAAATSASAAAALVPNPSPALILMPAPSRDGSGECPPGGSLHGYTEYVEPYPPPSFAGWDGSGRGGGFHRRAYAVQPVCCADPGRR